MPNYLRKRYKKAEAETLSARKKLIEAIKQKDSTKRAIASFEVQKAQQKMVEERYLRLKTLAQKAKKLKHHELAKKLEYDATQAETHFRSIAREMERTKHELTKELKKS